MTQAPRLFRQISFFLIIIILGLLVPINRVSAATLTRGISSGLDDGYQSNESLGYFRSTYTYGLTGEDDAGNPSYSYNGWMRFTNITIPQGSTIASATLTLRTTSDTFGSGNATTTLRGVDEDDHVAPTSTATWQADHAIHTTASVNWSFTLVGAGSTLTSPNIASIIQEIVDRPGWTSGNDIGIHWDENMSDLDKSQGWATYENTLYAESQLSITYTVAQCQDGSDNDGDGVADYSGGDYSCSSVSDTDETNPKAQCQDGINNDGDLYTDYPSDPGCSSLQDNNEANSGLTGSLTSSIFDTEIADGVKINSILWQGSIGAGGSVKFQIASSNSSSGPWTYIGYDGSSSTYYEPTGPGSNYTIPGNAHSNRRYFRYKVQIDADSTSTSPVVNDISINWSP